MILLDLAEEIHTDLDNPTSTSVPAIMFWLRGNLGNLNLKINSSYSLDSTSSEASPELSREDAAILKKMYFVYYYDWRIRENLGAASQDPVMEIAENGAVVRLVSKNSIAISYIQIKKQEQDELDKLITFYRGNNAVPLSVDGDDTTDVQFDGTNSIRSE